VGRIATLSSEIEQLSTELKRVYGYNGRPRRAGSVVERARINIRNNVSNALRLLKRRDLALWRHFDGAIRTGTCCSYRPERPIEWSF
jgi:hypothetical protein